jgi:hypothetical protein
LRVCFARDGDGKISKINGNATCCNNRHLRHSVGGRDGNPRLLRTPRRRSRQRPRQYPRPTTAAGSGGPGKINRPVRDVDHRSDHAF